MTKTQLKNLKKDELINLVCKLQTYEKELSGARDENKILRKKVVSLEHKKDTLNINIETLKNKIESLEIQLSDSNQEATNWHNRSYDYQNDINEIFGAIKHLVEAGKSKYI